MNNLNKVFIYNFTNIYKEESFYKHDNFKFIDLSNIISTRYILSDNAYKNIKKYFTINELNGIHFIDSGDYHYLTKLFCDLINYDFCLIVFDHHSDMKNDDFNNYLTCGNWINHVKNNKYLKKIIIVGPKLENNKLINDITENNIINASTLEEAKMLISNYPVYISIDKDILSNEAIETNWDQGILKEYDLLKAIDIIFNNDKVIGIDICGECEENISYYNEIKKDDKINADFINEIENDLKENANEG